MSKIGVIDIGSNTVRLVIFDGLARVPHYIFNEKAQCRLGAGLAKTGRLSPEGVELAREALKRFVYLARAMGVDTLDVVGTAALREADDGAAFVDQMNAALEIDIQVIDGEAEGVLSAKGVKLGWPNVTGIVCDIGGSSIELIELKNGHIGRAISLKMGPLKLLSLDQEDRVSFIEDELNRAQEFIAHQNVPIYLVGGSWRAIAKLDMQRRAYPLHILHEYRLPIDGASQVTKYIYEEDLNVFKSADISSGRGELLPLALEVLEEIGKRFQPTEYIISANGLREGLFYNRLPKDIRNTDPLINVSQQLEVTQARMPGFADKLIKWLMPLYENDSENNKRLVRAVCYLHDINWRFHPDFRAQMSFENIAQLNICGATHEERIFLALAAGSRYKNLPNHAIEHSSTVLLDEGRQQDAIALGRAIRLAAKISASVSDLLEETQIEDTGAHLKLTINKKYREINGAAIDKRLDALARISGKSVQVVFA